MKKGQELVDALRDLEQQIGEKERTLSEKRGQLAAVMGSLKEEFDVDSTEAAEALLERYRKQRDDLVRKRDALAQEVEGILEDAGRI